MTYLYIVALALAAVLLYGMLEKESVLVQDAMLKDPVLTMPLACDATVSQRGAGEKWVTLCYYRSAQ
jgi:hypothetical protein